MNVCNFPKVGEYAMHRGTLVRIDAEAKTGLFAITYVNDSGYEGGFSAGWTADEFTHITCPLMIARSRMHKARLEINEYRAKLNEAERCLEIYEKAELALQQIVEEAAQNRSGVKISAL